MNTIKEKLKRYYQSQDKLAPLFDDHEQSIGTCYIRLALLTQQQKDKMIKFIMLKINQKCITLIFEEKQGMKKVYCLKESHIHEEMVKY
ncbi:hypothetical protein RFI_02730 [Reticulomyxa filosa]|uniref:Uncharacterized protein n=1 Tax=Reticulomyxa filosa TaxID=46433 RepID=X6P8J7_RETFI|nr:hypothetical protein RFI_02730 [Reticulomyxa filosa]|eukprot:ETO34364.1 hypothetical protein RFI_02730 [Reticulomyxa filosa]